MSQQYFEEEVKHKIVKLHLERRKLKSLAEEYGIAKASISNWVKQYRNECQTNQKLKEENDYITENRKLRKELEEARKELRSVLAINTIKKVFASVAYDCIRLDIA